MCAPRDDDHDEDFEDGGYESASEDRSLDLGAWLEDRFAGDNRFTNLELSIPGDLEGENFRLRLNLDSDSQVIASVFGEEGIVRVGFSTDNKELNDALEEAILDTGESFTDFLAEYMGEDYDLDHEVHHFEDDIFYFCTDIPFSDERELGSRLMREQVVAYLNGYGDAFTELLDDLEESEDDEDEDDDETEETEEEEEDEEE